jgi:N6-adenosine-specific RNA methylase IME4
VKTDKRGQPKFGIGTYTRGSTEPCIIAVRGPGNVPVLRNIRQVVQTVPTRFAEKPDVVRKTIEIMYPDRNKVELFARQKFKGWTTTGNQLDGLDINEAIRRLAKKKERG